MKLVTLLTTQDPVGLAEVGGKALSLITLTRRGWPVPPGLVLTGTFFEPWLAAVTGTPAWADVLNSPPELLAARCQAAKALCATLEFSPAQHQALTDALATLPVSGTKPLWAVRSSSPEEDLETLSFAGGYETVLGVTAATLETAVRRAFASCLDARVLVYKREHGLDVTRPRIAVIVQQQLASETAGVAFSLNPLNNCYDEAVINANFGLGESVVAGQVNPDQFVVDKIKPAILARQLGKKETALWLAEDGGTYEQPAPQRAAFCLTDAQVLELTALVSQVEAHYEKPMDIEWAYAGGRLYLLQARPITGYFPLPFALRTTPGAPRRLYWDMTLTKWGMAAPLSVLGTDFIAITNTITLATTMGLTGPEALAATRPTLEGRVYVNASHNFKLQGKKRVAAEFRTMDTTAAEILEQLDETAYLPERLPPALRGAAWKVIGRMAGPALRGLQAVRQPEKYEQRYLQAIAALRVDLQQLAETDLPLRTLAERALSRMIADMGLIMSIVLAPVIAKGQLKRLFRHDSAAVRDRVASLERALPHNITIEMGLAMVQLAHFSEISECATEADFLTRLQARTLSAGFLQAWDQFMAQFGCRCPMEMDPATPRPYEQPAQLFRQLQTLALYPDQDPQALHQRYLAEREQTYQELLEIARRKGRRQARQFEHQYRVLVTLSGFRETPKYCFVLVTDLFRRRALQVGERLAAAGRLDTPAQVFDLRLADLERAQADPTLDLRALAATNTAYLRRFQTVREFPRIIDSRGQILRRPPKPAAPGEFAGDPIAPGTVRGPVKVLHTPDEKPVLPGDILVTRATDPGWTPLFINAAGVVLEVGGMLQHGALVAREYGKPCVAGLEGATELFQDGQLVELDGANGIVRLIQ